MNFHELLNQTYFDNSLQEWLIALGIALFLSLILNFFNKRLIKYLKSYAQKTENDVDDLFAELLHKTNFILLLIFSLYIGSLFLNVNESIIQIRKNILITCLLLQIGFWGSGLISYFTDRRINKESFLSGSKVTQIRVVRFIGKLFLWITIVLLVIDNLGFNITTLITGIGIGGIAITLAVQNVLSDIIASISIILDKPFEVGDYIIVDNLEGDVERIGLKTTRVRSISGEQLVFSNNDLLQSRIKNYKRMNKRRILFNLGVTYKTPHEKLEKIPDIVKKLIDEAPRAQFDRAFFKEYADSSLNYEIVYYVSSSSYLDYAKLHEQINLMIFKRFNEEGIEFAYPTQTVYLNKLQSSENIQSINTED